MNPNVLSFPTPKESLKTILMRELEELENRQANLMSGWYAGHPTYGKDLQELTIRRINLMNRISEIRE